MEEQFYLVIIMLVITALMLWQSYKINDFNVEGIIFGIRVPEKYRNDEKVMDVIKNYNKRITILTLLNAVILLGLYYMVQKVYIIIIYSYILALITMHGCYLANKKLKIVKKSIGWRAQSENKVYIQIANNKDKEKIDLSLFYIALGISILGIVITILKLPSLPKMVPIHFGINGIDNWADSSAIEGKLQVITLPVISIVCIMSMTFSARFQAKKDNTRFNGGTISSLILKKSYSIKSMTKMLGLISLGVSLIIFYVILLVLGIIEFTKTSNYIFMIITIGVILFPLIYWIYNSKKAKILKSKNDSNEKEIYRDDDKYYIGGIFYYNPKDLSNIVKKRIGYGLDFNYSHTFGRVMLLLEMAMLIGIIVVMSVLNI